MRELEQLHGEYVALREALEWITDCWGRDDEDYCRADMQGAIDNGRQTLASSPLSEKYAAVVSASLRVRRNQLEGQRFCTTATYGGNQEEWKKRSEEELEGLIAWENAVDALQEATK